VVVEGRNRDTARATGRPYEHQQVLVFTIRDD
jgi:ketosteroid isomerase-like protein